MSAERIKKKPKVENLVKARELRKHGGTIPYLMNNVTGVRDFVYKELVKGRVPASVFLKDLMAKFPSIPLENLPSERAVRVYRKQLMDGMDGEFSSTTALAAREEAVTMTVYKKFDYLAAQLEIYQLSLENYRRCIRYVDMFDENKKKMNYPDGAWRGVNEVHKALEEVRKNYAAYVELATRYGLLPAPLDKGGLTLNQNSFSLTQNNLQQLDNAPITEEQTLEMEQRAKQVLSIISRVRDNNAALAAYPRPGQVQIEAEGRPA